MTVRQPQHFQVAKFRAYSHRRAHPETSRGIFFSSLAARADIVGINPATSMSADFWQFWRSDYGFDKAAWFETYLQDRKLQPMKPGKTRRNSVSNTRRVIDWLLEEASPVLCLETNHHGFSFVARMVSGCGTRTWPVNKEYVQSLSPPHCQE